MARKLKSPSKSKSRSAQPAVTVAAPVVASRSGQKNILGIVVVIVFLVLAVEALFFMKQKKRKLCV